MGAEAVRPPAEQWWAINGADLLNALHLAHEGTLPGLVYLELIANSNTEETS